MSETNGNGIPPLTPIRKRILTLLSDGLPHRRVEFKACIDANTDMVSMASVHNQISFLRKLLKQQGEDIICEINPGTLRGIFYRHVRLLRVE